MSPDLTDRVALITGAARGIGRATAQRMLAAGVRVALVDREAARVESAAALLASPATADPASAAPPGPPAARTSAGTETRTLAIVADVTNAEQVRDSVRRVVDQFGRLDILVNSAGVLYPTRLREIAESEWQHTFDVNVKGVFLFTQMVIAVMEANGFGRIVNVSSTAGKSVSTLGGAHYTASKAAVLGFTRAAAKELAPLGITVNAVCPGLIDTEMVRANVTPERLRAYEESFPIARLGRPSEVAELIAFLASDDAAYITGAAFDITGGDLMV